MSKKEFSFLNHPDKETVQVIQNLIRNKVDLIKDITFDPLYHFSRDSDFWYRGNIFTIYTDKYNFSVDAIGDQRYKLFIRDWAIFDEMYSNILDPYLMDTYHHSYIKNEPIIEYVNKGNNHDTFFDLFGHIFKNDEDMKKHFNSYGSIVFAFSVENNNWLEIFVSSAEYPRFSTSINDPFSGYDVGSSVLEEFNFILDNMNEIIEYFESTINRPSLENERG